MADLVVELSSQVYERLKHKADELGKSPQELVQELVIRELATPEPAALSEQERGRKALLAAGLLTELGPELKQRADQSTLSLEEAHRILAASQGKSLSELVIEQREPTA